MTPPTKAYNELINVLLSPEDRQKFEWAIGAVLCDGPRNVVIIRGHAGTGKSTLLNIARKIVLTDFSSGFSPRVAFQHDGYREVDSDAFVFASTLSPVRDNGAIYIHTTGYMISVDKHHGLLDLINAELDYIAETCINTYRSLGENYYSTFEENNR